MRLESAGGPDSRGSNQPQVELRPSPPTLAISGKLDAPLAELGLWLEARITARAARKSARPMFRGVA